MSCSQWISWNRLVLMAEERAAVYQKMGGGGAAEIIRPFAPAGGVLEELVAHVIHPVEPQPLQAVEHLLHHAGILAAQGIAPHRHAAHPDVVALRGDGQSQLGILARLGIAVAVLEGGDKGVGDHLFLREGQVIVAPVVDRPQGEVDPAPCPLEPNSPAWEVSWSSSVIIWEAISAACSQAFCPYSAALCPKL